MSREKVHSRYVCQSCAYESARWIGKCPNCGEWNSFVEEILPGKRHETKSRLAPESAGPVPIGDVDVVTAVLIAPIAVVLITEHIGHLLVTSRIVDRDFVRDPGLPARPGVEHVDPDAAGAGGKTVLVHRE